MDHLSTIGIFSAVVIAWGALIARTARAHIDRRIDVKLEEQVLSSVRAAITNGVTERTDRIEAKMDKLIELHMWNGKERRG